MELWNILRGFLKSGLRAAVRPQYVGVTCFLRHMGSNPSDHTGQILATLSKLPLTFSVHVQISPASDN